jgi:hypothetical protein
MGCRASVSRKPGLTGSVVRVVSHESAYSEDNPVADAVWTVRASKADLEALLADIRRLTEENGGEAVIPADCEPRRVPRDPDSPMGQIEWYELILSPVLGAAGNALYEATKALIRKLVASFTEKPKE